MKDTRFCALIVAGGTGTRLGSSTPKQLLPLMGRPVLAHTLDRFLEFSPDTAVMVVLHASLMETWKLFVETNFKPGDHTRIHACEGGKERTESVENGLEALTKLVLDDSWVAIHDAVRPFIDRDFLQRGIQTAMIHGNATGGVPVKSSLRMRTDSGSKAIDRNDFFHVQTPQIFKLGEILRFYRDRNKDIVYTDDASLAEAAGMNIALFEGHYDNIKITTPEDMYVAAQLMSKKGWSNTP